VNVPVNLDGAGLRHVLIVGGTLSEWATTTPDAWDRRIGELGGRCSELGVDWLTVRVYERGSEPLPDPHPTGRVDQVSGCTVIVDPYPSGRQRFAEAMGGVDAEVEITEKTVAATLYAPADCEPDLVVVLGPPTQLPPSLMWEMAYAELVFTPVGWRDFGVDDLAAAVTDYSGRSRRFGGLGDE
jgi:hypothetical protein